MYIDVMAMLIDKIMDEDLKRRKSLKDRQSEAVKGSPEKMSDDEWQNYVKKKKIEEMRAAGAKLAQKCG